MAIPTALRRSIFERDDWTCQYCGWRPECDEDWTIPWGWNKRRASLDIDHMWPRSKGGEDDHWNLVTACYWCNIKKGAKFQTIPRADCCGCGVIYRNIPLDDPQLLFEAFGVIYHCAECQELELARAYEEDRRAFEMGEFTPIEVEIAYYDSLIAAGADMA